MKPDLNPVIGSTPTGGLELNFSLNREKANQINEREVPDQGLNPDESLHQVYLPTGGTMSLSDVIQLVAPSVRSQTSAEI